MILKNKCFATIYDGAINNEPIRKIHKKLHDMTINQPKLFVFMAKMANRTKKTINPKEKIDLNTGIFLDLLFNYNKKAKKIINHDVTEESEKIKREAVGDYIKKSRDLNKYIYLASSHDDCAKDHLPYQGKLYYDSRAPKEIVNYCESKGMNTIQWVMGEPAWFITRPNCRHFFKSLSLDVVKENSVKELTRKYKTHRLEGDRALSTPKKIAIEEYEDKLQMLKMMYREHKTERLRREIQKVELLINKWKKVI